jgi:predicted transcriptional regulator
VFLLAALGVDIRSYIDAGYMIDNRIAAVEMSRIVDAGIDRSKEALALETAELNNLSRAIQSLRTNDVRRSTSRKSNQPSAAAPNAQLVALEKRLADETAKRDGLKSALETQEAGRNAAIENAIARAPGHTPKRTGLSAQLAALGGLVHEDPKLLIFVIGFMIVSLALELGPMICSATHIPSTYAARVTLEHFLEVTKLAADGAQQLRARTSEGTTANSQDQSTVQGPLADALTRPANDNAIVTSSLNGATPPRRGRGRPRKNGPDRSAEGDANEE